MKLETLYAVKTPAGIAVHGDGGPKLFYRKRDAVKFKVALKPHLLGLPMKVVRVILETDL